VARNKKDAENAQLLAAIASVLEADEFSIQLPLTAVNQGIAQLSQISSGLVNKVSGAVLKDIVKRNVENDNVLDALNLAILNPLLSWQEENDLLLTQLAAQAGLTQPGDPLEAAITQSAADAPELAYSATLLLALRDAMGQFSGLIEVLREIRDRMPSLPVEYRGEPRSTAVATAEPEPAKYQWIEPLAGD
jgi:hypothetical protein